MSHREKAEDYLRQGEQLHVQPNSMRPWRRDPERVAAERSRVLALAQVHATLAVVDALSGSGGSE